MQPGSNDPLKIEYNPTYPYHTPNLNPYSALGNNANEACEINCSLFNPGCSDSFTGSTNIGAWSIYLRLTVAETGYMETVCVKCDNGAETSNIDNWVVGQCGKVKEDSYDDIILAFEG